MIKMMPLFLSLLFLSCAWRPGEEQQQALPLDSELLQRPYPELNTYHWDKIYLKAYDTTSWLLIKRQPILCFPPYLILKDSVVPLGI
jgi:hypothetical protein